MSCSKRPAKVMRVLRVSVPLHEVNEFLAYCSRHDERTEYLGHDLLYSNGVVEVINRIAKESCDVRGDSGVEVDHHRVCSCGGVDRSESVPVADESVVGFEAQSYPSQ